MKIKVGFINSIRVRFMNSIGIRFRIRIRIGKSKIVRRGGLGLGGHPVGLG